MPNPPEAFPTFLGDRYELTELLGKGAMGSVYRARDRHLERDVALKVVKEEQGGRRLERFKREGEITASLEHPGIVRVHTSGVVDGCPYLAYELLEGCRTLDEAVAGRTLPERVALIRDAAAALGYAHERGVIHRDVKNENLLVDRDGQLRVADFGLATAQGLERLTRTGALVGTPTHMSPEMIRGKDGIGPQTDVWGLGVVLYQALTGELPFQAATFTELSARILSGGFEDPAALNDVPPALAAVCRKALTVEPARRYPNGAAVAADLDAWLRGAKPDAQGSSLQLAAALAILAAGGVALAATLSRSPSPPPVREASASPEAPALPLPDRPTPTPKAGRPPGARQAVFRHGSGRAYARFHDERRALTWGDDGVVRTWDLRRCAETGRRALDLGRLTALEPIGPGVVVAGARGVAWIPDLEQPREPARKLLGPPGAYAVLPLPRRGSVLVARANKELVEVELKTAQVRRRLQPEAHAVHVLARSDDGARLLTSSGDPAAKIGLGDNVVRVIDVASGERLGRSHFQVRGSAVAFRPGRHDFLVGNGIGRLARFDPLGREAGEVVSRAIAQRPVLKPRAHEGTILSLAFTAGGTRLYSLSCGAIVDRRLDAPADASARLHTEIRCWNVADWTEVGRGLRIDQRSFNLAVSADGTQLLIGSEGRVELWTAP